MTEAEARERLVIAALNRQRSAVEGWYVPVALAEAPVDAILATTDALAVLLDWHELGKRATAEQVRRFLDAAAAAAGDEWTVIFRRDDWLPAGASDWQAVGRRMTPEQLTALLRGAEKAGRVTSEIPPGGCSLWSEEARRRWRIVPDEEGANSEES